ncbi:hypothetical protein BDV10DRAFT_189444 [Aspergillus recurvatus]
MVTAIYNLNVKTGEWRAIKGKTYTASKVKTKGNAYLQEANFGTDGVIATGIYRNDSTITFAGIEGTSKPQWVSFYYQTGGTPDCIGGSRQLRRISSVVVNGDTENVQMLYQRDTHKGIILSTPLQLTLKKGKRNTITVGALYNGFDYKGADLDRIVVYPPEE